MNWKPIFASILAACALSAEVVRVEIKTREDVPGFPYERLIGRAYFAVDPANAANRIITDIDKAPRNAAGKVEFSSDLYILKAKGDRSNGAAIMEISNRGGRAMERFFGDDLLLNQGYTLVWVGWQPDVPLQANLLRLYAPAATGITGLVRAEIIVTKKSIREGLADRNHIAYPVVDPEKAVMTVRDRVDALSRAVPRKQWAFSSDPAYVEMQSGFDPNKIYEVVYTSRDPVLVGLGPAAIRDFASYLKTEPTYAVKRVIGFGISQSGRFLRKFLYDGFNDDERGEAALDGMMAHVAGGGLGSFNHRFAQPSRDGHPFLNNFYPTDIFPFTDLPETDPETGVTDSIQGHSKHTPKIFYSNSSYEYWGRAASLISTTIDGKGDAKIPDNVRIYQFTGGQHGPAPFPPTRIIGQQLNSPNDYRFGMRALLTAMDRWVAKDTPPPPSAYPKVANGTLAPVEQLKFPKIPGVNASNRVHLAYRLDFGPQWKQGIDTIEPPKVGKPFPVMVPQVDPDGIDLSGVKMPEVAVPLATYLGWNLFNEQSGPVDELSSMAGSYIPFPKAPGTADPRRSVQERYHDKEQYLGKVSGAALELIRQGYLLEVDLAAIMRGAAARWDFAMSERATAGR